MNNDLHSNLKEILRNIASQKRVDPAELWQNLVLERFLVRLSQSQYSDRFILKGGVLLSHYIDLNRHTQDLDFLVDHIDNEVSELENVLREIIQIPISDGFTFTDLSINELQHPHMEYPGVRASMWGRFGKTRFRVKVDLGFGDIIKPRRIPLHLMKQGEQELFEKEVEINCYPIEFIFAEKFETMIYRGGSNSRMKDYHDLYAIIDSQNIDLNIINSVLNAVCEHRSTQLKIPITFDDGDIKQMQGYWSSYLRGLSKNHLLPNDFTDVVLYINQCLINHIPLPINT